MANDIGYDTDDIPPTSSSENGSNSDDESITVHDSISAVAAQAKKIRRQYLSLIGTVSKNHKSMKIGIAPKSTKSTVHDENKAVLTVLNDQAAAWNNGSGYEKTFQSWYQRTFGTNDIHEFNWEPYSLMIASFKEFDFSKGKHDMPRLHRTGSIKHDEGGAFRDDASVSSGSHFQKRKRATSTGISEDANISKRKAGTHNFEREAGTFTSAHNQSSTTGAAHEDMQPRANDADEPNHGTGTQSAVNQNPSTASQNPSTSNQRAVSTLTPEGSIAIVVTGYSALEVLFERNAASTDVRMRILSGVAGARLEVTIPRGYRVVL